MDAGRLTRWAAAALASSLAALALAAGAVGAPPNKATLSRLSGSVVLRYWIAHPEAAPAGLAASLSSTLALAQGAPPAGSFAPASWFPGLFNRDSTGLPQNEESLAVCSSNPSVALGGTNDFRGLLDPQGSSTGWHLSLDGGGTLAAEGLLPPVKAAGALLASEGDPASAADAGCRLYAASLNFDPFDFASPGGVGVYRSDPATLAACPGGSDPSCWPVRRAVAVAAPEHFLDKESLAVGASGAAGDVVWAAYTDFHFPSNPEEFPSSSIQAVRCDGDLQRCTKPIPISGPADQSVQFSNVTVGPDGRTYLLWASSGTGLTGFDQSSFKLRIAPPGSTAFGPERFVTLESLPLEGTFLPANDFRIASIPQSAVTMVDGHPRVVVVWAGCGARPLPFVCAQPHISLTYSDDDGRSWSPRQTLSAGGDNYFPAIGADPASGDLAAIWYTSRFDPTGHRQDVELATLSPSGAVNRLQRITPESNEPTADPLLGGFFIGDYISVAVNGGRAYSHYNANYRQIPLLGAGPPLGQQDNFLTVTGL